MLEEPIHQCAHCGVEGQDLRVQILTYFADFEDLYCKHCRAKAISINGSRDNCDGCSTIGPSLQLEEADLELFQGPGEYCQFCRMAHIDKMLERISPEIERELNEIQ